MTNQEKKIRQYIKDNPEIDFDVYLEKQLQNKKFKKYYDQESVKIALAIEVYRARQKKKLTQVQLAKTLRMPQANIARIEQGEHLPTLSTLSKIFNALGQAFSIRIGKREVSFG